MESFLLLDFEFDNPRLVSPEQMGERYKVLAIAYKKMESFLLLDFEFDNPKIKVCDLIIIFDVYVKAFFSAWAECSLYP
jgi:hypothetical protein